MKWIFALISSASLLFALSGLSSCKKNKGMSNGNLEFSVDTLVFDTIFTTIGSTTQQFKIYNNDKKELKIDEVELMGGSSSPFRMNLDGLMGTSFSNIDIPAEDSLFCFVEVTLQVNGQLLPMVVEDSIRFRTNGKDQYVKLAVWGQDMHYHYSNFKAEIYDTNEGIWENDKPHLVYGAAIVDSAKTLTIPEGTQIYMHKTSILYNYKGTMNFEGTQANKITIQGDRLESFYDDVAGQYYGVYYHLARPSTMEHVVIKNATSGVHVYSKDAAFSGTTLTMKKVEIKNPSSYGIFLFDGPKVDVENTLVYHSGIHALLVLKGAEFTFTHCNFMGYGAGDPTTPAVGIRNYFVDQFGTLTIASVPSGNFNNCVIDGYGDEQLVFDTLPGATLNFDFNKSVIKATASSHSMFTTSIFNQPVYFIAPYQGNFKFSNTASALSNSADAAFLTSDNKDIEDNLRSNPTDIGVYEIP
ncbi:MAG: right-handed parallel beta-helix repeat-containing protein [Fluviicola sp.]|nr:right-handed parallel beta-helix repeat-containing protein [Fluviicola sp.]